MIFRSLPSKILLAFVSISTLTLVVNAQVALKPIAEHFTNTKCSICGSKNPALIANLNANPSMMYLSIHPSSPYETCILSQQNTADNDARTNFYNVYGGTPRLILNGNVTNGSNFGAPNLFSPYLNLTSPFSINIQQSKNSDGSIISKVIVKAEASHNLMDALLFVGLAEDTVFVNGGNGEDEHYNVLRDALSAPEGMTIALPANIGDSLVFDFIGQQQDFWDFYRIFSVAILQDATSKHLIQTGRTDTSSGLVISSAGDIENEPITSVYPNPAGNILYIATKTIGAFDIQLFSPQGMLLHRGSYQTTAELNISAFSNGLYYLKLKEGIAHAAKFCAWSKS